MKAVIWDVPIRANTYRSNELLEVTYETGRIKVHLAEEDSENQWDLSFTSVQALRVVTWESAHEVLRLLPEMPGGFFELIDSELLQSLGAGRLEYMRKARHFIICCYDDIVEVVSHRVDISIRRQT